MALKRTTKSYKVWQDIVNPEKMMDGEVLGMVSVLLEEGLYSRKQVSPLPRPHIVDERSCPEVGGGVLGCVEKRKHICENFQFQR